jgi:hypothetical protein
MDGAKHANVCIQLLYVAGQSTSVGFADATGGLNRLRDDFGRRALRMLTIL